MKKKLAAFVFAVVMLFAFSTVSVADQIFTGDKIYLTDGLGGNNGLGGGLFMVHNTSRTTDVFGTFCIEIGEAIEMSDPTYSIYKKYDVNISNQAVGGGVGPNPDPLDNTTAYLYFAFRTKALTTAFDYNSASSIDALQLAIWHFEEAGYSAVYDGAYNTNSLAKALVAEAEANTENYLNKVAVINPSVTINGVTTQKQSLLMLVPEPMSLILFGLGLLGLGAARRFKK